MDNTQKICEKAAELVNKNGVAVIGIDGLGGAGKSTISEGVCACLEKSGIHTILLHIDDFITPRKIRYDERFPQWQCYYELQWRYDYLRRVIDELRQNGKVTAELYDKENDSYISAKYCTDKRTVIIIEGIFLQRKELDGVFGLMVYMDVPEEERLKRVLTRDTYIGDDSEIRRKYEDRYFPAERRYVQEYEPAQKADMVIKA